VKDIKKVVLAILSTFMEFDGFSNLYLLPMGEWLLIGWSKFKIDKSQQKILPVFRYITRLSCRQIDLERI